MPLKVVKEDGVVTGQGTGQVLKLERHGGSGRGEVVLEPLHQGGEGDVGVGFVAHDVQDRARHVAHSLAIAGGWVVNAVRRQDVEKLLHVGVVIPSAVERVLSIRPEHILPHHSRGALQFFGHLQKRMKQNLREIKPRQKHIFQRGYHFALVVARPMVFEPLVLFRLPAHILHPLAPVQPVRVDVKEMLPNDSPKAWLQPALEYPLPAFFDLDERPDTVPVVGKLGIRQRGRGHAGSEFAVPSSASKVEGLLHQTYRFLHL